MTSDWLGGGLIVGLAAVLWLVYLLPTWFRRNEFNATERNVVRLQQTLRILAETSEVPDEVRAEASAKSVVEHQRMLKRATVNSIPPAVRAAARIRRARALTSAVLVLGLAVVVLGAVQTVVNGAWIVLIAGLITATLCVTRLVRLAKLGRAVKLPARVPGTVDSFVIVGAGSAGVEGARVFFDGADSDAHESAGAGVLVDAEGNVVSVDGLEQAVDGTAMTLDQESGWVPVPLPKPLYTERRRLRQLAVGQPVLNDATTDSRSLGYAEQTAAQAEDALRAAAATAEQALRVGYAASDARAAARGADGADPHDADPYDAALAARGADSHDAALAARGADFGAEVAGIAVSMTAPSIPSRFSAMGFVDEAETGSLDVDRVLARRRAG